MALDVLEFSNANQYRVRTFLPTHHNDHIMQFEGHTFAIYPPLETRRGFTLLEMMLVLSIIAIIGAIAVPRLEEVFERQKLRGAANTMRLEWDTARLTAMRTGQAQVFSCVPGTGTFSIKPLMMQADVSNAGGGATVMLSGGNVAQTQSNGLLTAADPTLAETQELEDKMTFVSCQVANDMRAYTSAQNAQLTGASDVNTQTVGQAVIFYPDGSTSTAELRIQNERGDIRAVQIRGLTGHSRVVDIANVASVIDDQRKR